MPARRRGSIRLWQTELFVVVIIVAILILSGSLSAGLKATLTRMTETSERRNASALAQRLASAFPLGVDGTAGVRSAIAEYRDIYGGGIWVYDSEGELLASEFDAAPTDAAIESALLWGLEEDTPHVTSDLSAGGWVVAAHPGLDGHPGPVDIPKDPLERNMSARRNAQRKRLRTGAGAKAEDERCRKQDLPSHLGPPVRNDKPALILEPDGTIACTTSTSAELLLSRPAGPTAVTT